MPEPGDGGLARLRPAAVAGSFYPSDAARLAAAVERLLRDAGAVKVAPSLQGLIVPHAGYRYSGPIAASGYSLLRAGAAAIDRLVLIGPAHFVPLYGAAVPAADGWLTPLGPVGIDGDLALHARALGARVDDAPHAPEHALEVQLPFLQIVLGHHVPILPVAVGVAETEWVADLLGALLGSAPSSSSAPTSATIMPTRRRRLWTGARRPPLRRAIPTPSAATTPAGSSPCMALSSGRAAPTLPSACSTSARPPTPPAIRPGSSATARSRSRVVLEPGEDAGGDGVAICRG